MPKLETGENLLLAKIKIARICAIERACTRCKNLTTSERLLKLKRGVEIELERELGMQGLYLPKANDSCTRVLC